MALLSEADRFLLNRMNGTARKTRLGDQLNIQVISSTAATGGGASESLTVTGLAADDTILAVSARVGAAAVVAYDTQIANGLDLTWTGDPGAGAIVDVLVLKAAADE